MVSRHARNYRWHLGRILSSTGDRCGQGPRARGAWRGVSAAACFRLREPQRSCCTHSPFLNGDQVRRKPCGDQEQTPSHGSAHPDGNCTDACDCGPGLPCGDQEWLWVGLNVINVCCILSRVLPVHIAHLRSPSVPTADRLGGRPPITQRLSRVTTRRVLPTWHCYQSFRHLNLPSSKSSICTRPAPSPACSRVARAAQMMIAPTS